MPSTPITQPHWDLIIERIHKGRCVAFLGAGVNATSDEHGYEGLPLGGDVALRLLANLTRMPVADLRKLVEADVEEPLEGFAELARPSLGNLARVALHYVTNKDYPDLMEQLATIITDEGCEPSPLLRTLARLPFGLIVTTNYDRLMERALEDAEKPFKLVVQPVKGFVERRQRRKLETELASGDTLVLYKLHGSFPGAGAADGRLIVTEEDYIEYLTVVGIKDVGVPSLVAEKIADSTLLFLGYTLEDWDFRTIFKGVVGTLPEHEHRRSFAIQKSASEFWVTLWKKQDVEIYNVDLHEFAGELADRYGDYLSSAGG